MEPFASANSMFNSLLTADSTPRVVALTDGTSPLLTALDPNAVLAAPLMGQSSDYYSDYISYATAWGVNYTDWGAANKMGGHIIPINTAPTTLAVSGAPNAATATSYAAYLMAYAAYLNTLTRANAATFGTPIAITLSTDVTEYPAYIAAYTAYLFQATQTRSESTSGAKFNFFLRSCCTALYSGGGQ